MSFTTSLGYTPQFQINKGGADVTKQFQDRVTMIQVTSLNGGGDADKLTISLDDRDWSIATPSTDGDGQASLDLYLGYAQTGLYAQGSFSINEIYLEGMPKTMRLVGQSIGFQSALKSPLLTSYNGQTLNSIIGSIASTLGVSAVVDPELGSKTIDFLNQNVSSGHLLQQLERTYNGLAKVGDGTLAFTKRGSGMNTADVFAGGFTLTPEDFGSWQWRIINRTAYSQVKASWLDKSTWTYKWETNTTAAQGNSQAPFTMRRVHASQDEAKSAADAAMQAANRGTITGTITLAKGDPSIHGGAPFTVSGMKADAMDGSYVANRVTHTYTKDGGIQTTIEFMLPGDGSDFSGAAADGQFDTQPLGINPDDVTPITTTPTSGHAGSA